MCPNTNPLTKLSICRLIVTLTNFETISLTGLEMQACPRHVEDLPRCIEYSPASKTVPSFSFHTHIIHTIQIVSPVFFFFESDHL